MRKPRDFADRHVKLLIQFAVEGSLSGACSQPTHDTVHRRVGTGLDKLGQFGLLPRREF